MARMVDCQKRMYDALKVAQTLPDEEGKMKTMEVYDELLPATQAND